MKQVVSILTLAAALFAVSVQQLHAQIVEASISGGVSVAASVASNLPVSTVSIDCSSQQNVAIQWSLQLASAGTEVHGIRFIGITEPGVRPTVPTLADGFYIAGPATGTTPAIFVTNFNVKGFSRLDLQYITNGTAALSTNVIKYWVKRNAP